MDQNVSIIVIGRNEELTIGKCFDAANAAASQIGGAEMIYVDSHSTDDTVTIARRHGFAVLGLGPGLRMTPSAGRYWGSLQANGDLVLFLDADTIIDPDYLPVAINYFQQDPTIGGMNGYIDDFDAAGRRVLDIDVRFDEMTDVEWLRGPACFYRRDALLDVGSFDPRLATEEEAELGLRLLRGGWKLRSIPKMMARHTRCHHTNSFKSIVSTFRRDIRSRRLGEITRTIAASFRAGNGSAFCWLRLKTTILFLVWLSLIAACLLLPNGFDGSIFAAIIASLGVLMLLIKKRSIWQTLLFIPAKALCLVDLSFGLLTIMARDVPSHFRTDRRLKPSSPVEQLFDGREK